MRFENLETNRTLRLGSDVDKTNYSTVWQALNDREFAEVLIECDQHPLLAVSLRVTDRTPMD